MTSTTLQGHKEFCAHVEAAFGARGLRGVSISPNQMRKWIERAPDDDPFPVQHFAGRAYAIIELVDAWIERNWGRRKRPPRPRNETHAKDQMALW